MERPAPSQASWAGDPPAREAAQTRLLEAAARCIVRDGPGSASISSVAAEAGVSRPTVYRYFADWQALLRETSLQAHRVLARDLAAHIEGMESAGPMAVEAFVFLLREKEKRPLLRALWHATTIDSVLLAESTEADAVDLAGQALAPLVKAAGWSKAESAETIEWMLRVLLSLLVAPGRVRSEAELRSMLERFLIPSLGIPTGQGD